MEPKIAVVVVTRNEPKLGRAVQSLCAQSHQPHAVFIMNDDTRTRGAKRALRASPYELRQAGIQVIMAQVPGVSGPAKLRTCAYHMALDWPVELVAAVDADDELSPDALANLARAFRTSAGTVDVFSPSEIMVIKPDGEECAHQLPMPQWPGSAATEADAAACVEYTRHGATFAVTAEALQRLGYGHMAEDRDEWVTHYLTWLTRGARFHSYTTHAAASYHYYHHPPSQQFADRRAQHEATRVQAALQLLLRGRL